MDAALTVPGPWFFEILSPLVRSFDALARGSWKKMILSAEERLPGPVFALEQAADRYLLKALVPGATAAEVRVDVRDDVLRLRGRTQVRFADGGSFGYVRERPLDERFTLPPDADGERATCALSPGGLVLVTIPRHPCVAAEATAGQE